MKIKRRIYSDKQAYFLANGITASLFMVGFLIVVICFIIQGKMDSQQGLMMLGGLLFMMGIGAIITIPVILKIKKNAPKELFRRTLFDCYKLGIKISFKVSLNILGFLFGSDFVSWSIGYPVIAEDENGHEIWLKYLGDNIYEDTSGKKYKIQ